MQYVIPSTRDPLEEVLGGLSSLSPGQSCVLGTLGGSGPAYLLARSFSENPVTTLAVLPSLEDAEVFLRELDFFLGPGLAFILPPTERLPFEESLIHPEITATRLKILYRLTQSEPVIVVTVASNLMERLIPSGALVGSVFRLCPGEIHPRDELIERFINAGFARTNMVEERGEVSVRGDIVDIFAPMGELPLRIEFFDDEIESIREFDPASQRSTTQVEELVILPAREVLLPLEARSRARARLVERADDLALERPAYINISSALRDGIFLPSYNAMQALFYDRLDTIFDYLNEDTLITLVEPAQIADEFEVVDLDLKRAVKKKTQDGVFFVEPISLYLDADEVHERLKGFRLLELSRGATGKGDVYIEGNFDLTRLVTDKTRQTSLKALIERIKKWLDSCACVFISAHNKGQAERTRELLEGYGLMADIGSSTDIISGARPARLKIVVGMLGAGFKTRLIAGEVYEDDDLFDICLISEEEVFGPRIKHRPPTAGKLKNFLSELRDLSRGDGIVHVLHGIAIYRGLKRLEVEGVENDFLILEYRGKDRLYLPVHRMDQVMKYHGLEGRGFTPDKLGGPGWGKRQEKVKKAVRKIAVELLKLYAEREASKGFAFSQSCHLYREFCASFEFTETPDQLRSIAEVNADMERARPMDRLLCADVGYGKTEVAMRAAFKAVLDGKQVAILVPTTVLAQQHAMTFTERFSAYPVRVDVLSRFRGKAEQNKVIEMAAKGEVDILIGTHRLLGRDISFADLGLVVVDEEHRFGVKHKERLRGLKSEVDVLTLTATPIPRTLQMSITDIRALSIISTPPEDRLAIKTTITPFDEGVIKNAIEREMRRSGQIFFVHNRVESISNMATLLNSLVPQARVAVAHGQMNEHELENKMLGFVKYDYDILLCTTIIESGLDIARANTIIINRADRFGLAELYQLRGRVGRSNHRAYAYLLSPTGSLSPDARKRLDAIVSLTGPGSGFRVASYDLEIRGAGELLGASQSGHISEVGFDMYTTLLEEAVSELKGERKETKPAPEVNIRVSAYIPDDYIPDTRQRLGVYKRLSEADSLEDLVFMAEELEDRYGDIPELVYNLIKMAEIRLDLTALGALELKQLAGKLYITFTGGMQNSAHGPDERVSKKALELIKKDFTRYRATPDGKFVYTMADADGLKPTDPLDEARYILKEFLKK